MKTDLDEIKNRITDAMYDLADARDMARDLRRAVDLLPIDLKSQIMDLTAELEEHEEQS